MIMNNKFFKRTITLILILVLSFSLYGCKSIGELFHKHNAVYVEAVEATCEHEGNVKYWYCADCDKYFIDEECNLSVEKRVVILPKTQHVPDDNGICTVCGKDLNVKNLLKKAHSDYGFLSLTAKEQEFYNLIDQSVSTFHESGDAIVEVSNDKNFYTLSPIDFSAFSLTSDRALDIFRVYIADHPLYYWIDATTLYTDKKLYPVVIDEFAKSTDRIKTTELLEKSIFDAYSYVDILDSTYQKTLGYHDYIVDAIDYSYDESGNPNNEHWAHSILGVFLEGVDQIDGAVCEGYAKSFQLLLNLAEIDNVYVVGVGKTSTRTESHAWNMALIDGSYYYFDLTWDEHKLLPNDRGYDYFCKDNSDTQFTSSHVAHKVLEGDQIVDYKIYDLPENVATTPYAKKDKVFTKFELDNLTYVISGYKEAQLIKSNKIGQVVIPDKVTFNTETYQVTTIGTYYNESTPISNVFSEGATSVSIPSSVSFIWDVSFRSSTIKSFSVDAQNPYFTADSEGVLYTKNMFTLVCYPAGKLSFEYMVPTNCKIIALFAFDNTKLSSLVLTSNVTEFYMPNCGLGYVDNLVDYNNKLADITNVSIDLTNNGTKNRLTLNEFKDVSGIRNVTVK